MGRAFADSREDRDSVSGIVAIAMLRAGFGVCIGMHTATGGAVAMTVTENQLFEECAKGRRKQTDVKTYAEVWSAMCKWIFYQFERGKARPMPGSRCLHDARIDAPCSGR